MKSRILDIAWYNDLSHLGSYFSAAGIIEEIFETKKKDDIFILSSLINSFLYSYFKIT